MTTGPADPSQPFGADDEAFTEDSVVAEVLAGSGFMPTANVSPGALPAGWALNEYRVESLLGGGGFGLTYLAHDTLLDCKVAIKEFLPTDIAVRGDGQRVMPRSGPAVEMFEQGLRRFLDESRALANFRHPNIVRVSRFFEANGSAYMVMDYEQGRPLNQWVRERNAPMDKATLLAIVRPLLEGLQGNSCVWDSLRRLAQFAKRHGKIEAGLSQTLHIPYLTSNGQRLFTVLD